MPKIIACSNLAGPIATARQARHGMEFNRGKLARAAMCQHVKSHFSRYEFITCSALYKLRRQLFLPKDK